MTGSCFGFELRADHPLVYARGGPGHLPLEVRASDEVPDHGPTVRGRWEDPRTGAGSAVLYEGRRPDTDVLHIHRDGWFGVDRAARRVTVPAGLEALRREERLWSLPSMLVLLHEGVLVLHAAAVEVDGRAVVFGAPSRHGKTTLAAAFVRRGYRLLTEDLCAVEVDDAGPRVRPGPAMLRVRVDVADAMVSDHVELLDRDADRAHLRLREPGDGRSVPLGALVLLRDGSLVDLMPHEPTTALPDVWALATHHASRDGHARCLDQICAVIDAVPVLDLARPLRLDALDDALETLVDAVRHADV